MHFFHHSVGVFLDFISRCLAVIHDDESLILVGSRLTVFHTFETSLFDEPARWNFYFLWGLCWVPRHVWKFVLERFEGYLFDDGIFKKTSSISQNGWIGQLGLANMNDSIADVADRWGLYLHLF